MGKYSIPGILLGIGVVLLMKEGRDYLLDEKSISSYTPLDLPKTTDNITHIPFENLESNPADYIDYVESGDAFSEYYATNPDLYSDMMSKYLEINFETSFPDTNFDEQVYILSPDNFMASYNYYINQKGKEDFTLDHGLSMHDLNDIVGFEASLRRNNSNESYIFFLDRDRDQFNGLPTEIDSFALEQWRLLVHEQFHLVTTDHYYDDPIQSNYFGGQKIKESSGLAVILIDSNGNQNFYSSANEALTEYETKKHFIDSGEGNLYSNNNTYLPHLEMMTELVNRTGMSDDVLNQIRTEGFEGFFDHLINYYETNIPELSHELAKEKALDVFLLFEKIPARSFALSAEVRDEFNLLIPQY